MKALALISLALLLGACQTPEPTPPPLPIPIANSAAPPGPILLPRALEIAPPKNAQELRADFLELSILRQELSFTRRLVLLRRQERAIWRQRLEDRQADLKALMAVSRDYQAAGAERDRLVATEAALHRKIASALKRPAATLELDFSGLVRDAGSLSIDLESLVHMAQTHRADGDEVAIAQNVRESFQNLATSTTTLAEFAGDTSQLMSALHSELRNLDQGAEPVPDELVEARIELISARLHGLQLLRSQQRAVLALEDAIGEPLSLATFPDVD